MQGITNVVLVHGAWADGSSWSKIIPLLKVTGLVRCGRSLSPLSSAKMMVRLSFWAFFQSPPSAFSSISSESRSLSEASFLGRTARPEVLCRLLPFA